MKATDPLNNPSGAALVYLITALLAMSVLGTAMYELSTTATIGEVSANHLDRAYYIAEAGGAYAYPLVRDDIQLDGTFDDTDGIHNQSFTLDDATGTNGQFTVEVDDSDSGFTLVTVTGTISGGVSGGTEAKIVYTMTKTGGGGGGGGGTSPFTSSVFGGNSINMNSQSKIKGDAATNAGSINQGWHANITGSTTLNAGTTMDSLTFDCTGCTANGITGWNQTLNVSGGTYDYNNLMLASKNTVNITGDVTLYVKGNFILGWDSLINIASDASLTIIVDGSATFSTDTRVNLNGGDSNNFVIYGTQNASSINFGWNSRIEGAVYAPDSNVNLLSSARFKGGLVGNNVYMGWNSEVTWDSDVSNVTTTSGAGGTGGGGGGTTVGLPAQYFAGQ